MLTRGRATRAFLAAVVPAAALGWLACGRDEGTLEVSIDSGAPRCPGEAPDADLPWSPPPAEPVAACDARALAVVEALLDPSAAATFTTIESSLRAAYDGGGAACASCMFGGASAATWAPVVYVDGGAAIVNYGACYARAPGGSDACGRAVQQQIACLDAVCNLSECNADVVRGCAQNALQDQDGCGRFPVNAACGGALTDLAGSCRTLLDVVTRLCGAPAAVADAGAR